MKINSPLIKVTFSDGSEKICPVDMMRNIVRKKIARVRISFALKRSPHN